jgi:hypothetical protein
MNAADNTMTVEQAYRAMLAFLQREVEAVASARHSGHCPK